jgi:hypothetical protein
MSKTHRFAGSHILIGTALPANCVAAIAVDLTSDIEQLRFHGADKGVLRFTINNPLLPRMEWIVFSLALCAEAGRTIARTTILRYQTNQSRVMFVPVASTQMLGYPEYVRFMDLLAGGVRIEDPDSTATVNEETGS